MAHSQDAHLAEGSGSRGEENVSHEVEGSLYRTLGHGEKAAFYYRRWKSLERFKQESDTIILTWLKVPWLLGKGGRLQWTGSCIR